MENSMKKLSICMCFWSMVSMCCVPMSFGADNQQADQETSPVMSGDSWIASGNDVMGASWWKKNAYNNQHVSGPLFYSFAASYAYSGVNGSVESEKHNISTELALRKQLFTSITFYDVSKDETDLVLSGMSITVEQEKFEQFFRYALTDWLEAVGAIQLTKNDSSKYLKNRKLYFIGPWADLLQRPNLYIGIGGSYAYLDTAYMNEQINPFIPMYEDFTPVDDYDSEGLYFLQMLSWNITDKIVFTENTTYLQDLDNTDYYNLNVHLALEFALTDHLSVVSSYTVDYDYNSFVESVQNYLDKRTARGETAGELDDTNSTVNFSIKITF
ncbi:MAG: DUF481 domain-containing protein [Candidatus Electrothrix sp. MAN1_4]|nr:DUF481 domain-containing protein [Candidatus Electrothrix sp. MAN1_4]